jgi:hypothetical protein
MYNDAGGYTLGRVWADASAPNPAAALFPEGTVAVKLLFTQATPEEVPFLQGAPEWTAYVDVKPGVRGLQTLRLLQIDIAVRDGAADPTGWVFGTFQYDRDAPGMTPWQKVVPVALTWGNDPGVTPDDVSLHRKSIKESWINPAAPIVDFRNKQGKVMGWAGRANGPVDNTASSCLSCHSTAQHPAFADLVPPGEGGLKEKLCWFRNLRQGQAFTPQAQSLGSSLQLAAGIQNFYQWVASVQRLGAQDHAPLIVPPARSPFECDPQPVSLPKRRPEAKAHLLEIYRVSRDEADPQPLKTLQSDGEAAAPPPRR